MIDTIATPTVAPPTVAPTVDALTWDEAITLGSQAWESAEQSKWDLGDIGAVVAHKWQQDSIKKFANDIGMHDNPRRLYEYVEVAQHYPKSARALFPTATWSSWRECSRHGLTPAASLEMMRMHSDKPVAAIRRAIIGKPSPRPVTRVEFEAAFRKNDIRFVDIDTALRFAKLCYAHPDAVVQVTVTWTEAAK